MPASGVYFVITPIVSLIAIAIMYQLVPMPESFKYDDNHIDMMDNKLGLFTPEKCKIKNIKI
jgi:hypothetical protein